MILAQNWPKTAKSSWQCPFKDKKKSSKSDVTWLELQFKTQKDCYMENHSLPFWRETLIIVQPKGKQKMNKVWLYGLVLISDYTGLIAMQNCPISHLQIS